MLRSTLVVFVTDWYGQMVSAIPFRAICANASCLLGFQQDSSLADPEVCFTLDHGHELHLRDRSQNIRIVVACHELGTALRRSIVVVAPVGRGLLVASRIHAFWSLFAPLATSVLKSGTRAMPGIFRPWAFSTLRRFTPSDTSPVLFHTSATCEVQRTEWFERDPRVLVGSS